MATEEEDKEMFVSTVLHWNYRNLTEFPIEILSKTHRCSKIKDIYLKENRIARLPNEIAVLDRLESLYLSGNEIRSVPREISRLQRLKCLDLSGNYLCGLPEEMGELSGLKCLVLDDNRLRALPLWLADLRGLRYLSVCDNRLTWLPQRPVYNLQHCELRVWRNPQLRSLPYSLWYHMFRDQQIRCLNIGCWATAAGVTGAAQNGCVLKMHSDAAEWEIEISAPAPYRHVMASSLLDNTSPPSLLELCRRGLYELLYRAARRNSTKAFDSIYSDAVRMGGAASKDVGDASGNSGDVNENYGDVNGNGNQVNDSNVTGELIRQESLFGTDIEKLENKELVSENRYPGDENNNVEIPKESRASSTPQVIKQRNRYGITTTEIIQEYFDFLPPGLKGDMKNGPPSRCENIPCKRPVFDYAFLQFCQGSIVLIDSTQGCVLSAAFCSRGCARRWAGLKTSVVPWNPKLYT